jgi:hypothetical protein
MVTMNPVSVASSVVSRTDNTTNRGSGKRSRPFSGNATPVASSGGETAFDGIDETTAAGGNYDSSGRPQSQSRVGSAGRGGLPPFLVPARHAAVSWTNTHTNKRGGMSKLLSGRFSRNSDTHGSAAVTALGGTGNSRSPAASILLVETPLAQANLAFFDTVPGAVGYGITGKPQTSVVEVLGRIKLEAEQQQQPPSRTPSMGGFSGLFFGRKSSDPAPVAHAGGAGYGSGGEGASQASSPRSPSPVSIFNAFRTAALQQQIGTSRHPAHGFKDHPVEAEAAAAQAAAAAVTLTQGSDGSAAAADASVAAAAASGPRLSLANTDSMRNVYSIGLVKATEREAIKEQLRQLRRRQKDEQAALAEAEGTLLLPSPASSPRDDSGESSPTTRQPLRPLPPPRRVQSMQLETRRPPPPPPPPQGASRSASQASSASATPVRRSLQRDESAADDSAARLPSTAPRPVSEAALGEMWSTATTPAGAESPPIRWSRIHHMQSVAAAAFVSAVADGLANKAARADSVVIAGPVRGSLSGSPTLPPSALAVASTGAGGDALAMPTSMPGSDGSESYSEVDDQKNVVNPLGALTRTRSQVKADFPDYDFDGGPVP